jgi:hypothetical protein
MVRSMEGFRVVDVLRTSFRVWKRNLLPFTLIALVINAPDIALRFAITDPNGALALLPFSILLNTLLSASLTYGVVMELHGTRQSLRTCIQTGFKQLVPVIGVVVVSTLGIAGGLVLLVVPGVILMLAWYVVVPVAIIERPGVMATLKRSRELTMGYKAQLFALVLVTSLPVALLPYATESILSDVEYVIVTAVSGALIGSFIAVTTAVAYTALRQVKEGTRVPEIASAFARFKT